MASVENQRSSATSSIEINQLITKVAQGDLPSFEKLYDLVAPLVYGVCLRVLRDKAHAEEVAQEVFIEIWQQAGRFSSNRGSGKSWISIIAHRRAVDRVRSEQSSRERDFKMHDDQQIHIDATRNEIELHLENDSVREALGMLPKPQQTALYLAYFQGYTYSEVAKLLKTPAGTIKTRIREGLIKLRDFMEVD